MQSRAVPLATAAALLLLAAAPAPADPVERGHEIYRQHCLECHGKEGHGDGPKAQRMGFKARDFALGAFKCRSTPSGRRPTDADLERVVAQGLPGTPMLGRADELPPEDRRAVVEYLKTLAPKLAAPEPEPIGLPPPPDQLAALAEEGKRVYQVLGCWTCHGASGRGDGPAAAGLVDDWGNRIRVFNFVVLRRFKCGGEPRDLYRTLHTGMTGSPMPSYTEAFRFGREDAEALAALESAYDAEELARFASWLADQPERAAIAAVAEDEVAALVEHRTWALVAYLRSLAGR